jgi:molecular chaperone DnaK (HSP70)
MVGIDLGTTYSRVAVWRNNRVIVIPNENGNLHTPSCVAFTDSGILIGDDAKEHASDNPTNTIPSKFYCRFIIFNIVSGRKQKTNLVHLIWNFIRLLTHCSIAMNIRLLLPQ